MFDLFEIFSRTFAEYYKQKRLAKRQIKSLKDNLAYYKKMVKLFKAFKDELYKDSNHRLWPTIENAGGSDFVGILNFFMYGIKVNGDSRNGQGYIDHVKYYHIEKLENCITSAEYYFNNKRYDEVAEVCRRYYNSCVTFDERYGTTTRYDATYPGFKENEQN